MRKTCFTLCLALFGGISAMAHAGHRSVPHIHLTESVSIEVTIVLSLALSLTGIYLFKKLLKKKKLC